MFGLIPVNPKNFQATKSCCFGASHLRFQRHENNVATPITLTIYLIVRKI